MYLIRSCLFVSLTCALLLSVVVPPARPQAQRSSSKELKITHGPILGRPGTRTMGVWARTARPGEFRILYGLSADRLDRISSPVRTRLANDNTAWVLVSGLKPNTRYYYQVLAGGSKKGPGGTFRTLPDRRDYIQPTLNPKGLFNFSFVIGCCANQSEHSRGPSLPAYQSMLARAKDKVHFAIHNGDFIYEEAREFSPKQWLAQVGARRGELPPLVRQASSLTGVWENYKLYLRRGKNLAAWHRHVPCYFTFDDHEILNDVEAAGQTGFRHRRTVFRDIALKGWYDYVGWSNPVAFTQKIQFGRARLKEGSDILTDFEARFTRLDFSQAANLHVHWGTPDAGVNEVALDKKPGDPNAGVYEVVDVLDDSRLRIYPKARKDGKVSYSIGRRSYFSKRVGNCDFYFLDTRTHRQKHDSKNPLNPKVSMLGKRQKEWLKKAMARSNADCFFVVSSVNLMIPHVGAGGMAFAAADKDDAWTAFLHEREELLKFWDGLGRPVIVFTGDLHNSWAIKVTDRVWEFAAGPLNSRNHPAKSEGSRPSTGIFNSRGRKCDIRWSTYVLDDVPQKMRNQVVYCVVQVNNAFNSQLKEGKDRWVAYTHPQVVLRFYDGDTSELLYAEAIRIGKGIKKE